MPERIETNGLKVDQTLYRFINDEALPGTGVSPETFWAGLAALISDLGPTNRALLDNRAEIQAKIDAWHKANPARPIDQSAYQAFLKHIGYLVPEGPEFAVTTENVDPEIATLGGPQLVVPVMNARYALNAANARWGSLYDALYGTDALGDLPRSGGYDPERGTRVIAWAKAFLDRSVPLEGASWADVTSIEAGATLIVSTSAGTTGLQESAAYAGHAETGPWRHVLLKNNGLGIEILINPDNEIGKTDPA
ncbi:MAG: malate synthase G, partial [Pseudomonadota bacterium]